MRVQVRVVRWTAVAASAALALVIAGCGGSDGEEGLVVYTGRNENLVEPLFEQFEEQTGIPVSARYGDSASLAAQLLEEGDRSPAAMFLSQDAGALGALQDVGQFDRVPQSALDRVPAQYRSATGAWVGLTGRARVLVYNKDVTPAAELPASVFDLVDPRYRGKVGYAPTNASWQAFVTSLRVTEGEDGARAFLEAFKANDPQAYENNVLILDAVDGGQLDFGLTNHYYFFERAANTEGGLDALNAAIHRFEPGDPGNLVNVTGVGVLKGRSDERTAQLVDFLLGQQAQTFFAEENKEFPLISGVAPDVPGLPPLAELEGPDIDLSQLDTLQETLALLDQVGLS